MRRPPLYVSQILKWADAHFKRTGVWPKVDSGRVTGVLDESWINIDQALRKGLRGLPARWSLAQLLSEHRGKRNRKRLPKYSLRQILSWADAHHDRTGRWPTNASGRVADAPGETWLAVDMALSHGRRGLPGGSSLPALLAQRRAVRNKLALPKLKVATILEWIDTHHRRTGNWPTEEAGPIPRSGGETWRRVDQALKKHLRGLRAKSSLAQLLEEHHGVRRHVRKPLLTIDQILTLADAHHRRTGRWPSATSGPIAEMQGETWLCLQAALAKGTRGLPGGMTIAKLLFEQRALRTAQHVPPLSMKQISEWIDQYYRRHRRWPTRDSGAISNSDGETWRAVDLALKRGRRGLSLRSSLARLVWFRQRRLRTSRTRKRTQPRPGSG